MGDSRGMTRMLLECNLTDKLCILRENQYEVVIVPTIFVAIFLILLGVILWLHFRGQRIQRQLSGLQGIAPMPPSRGLSWEAAGLGGNIFARQKQTSVEGLLQATAPTLAKLQVPREQLSEVLEEIYNGTYGTIYRTKMNSGDSAKPKSVVLKTLRESAGFHEIQDFLGRIQFHHLLGKHKNLVQLEGCCTQTLPLYMILEDVSQGDLLNFLWTCRRDVMTMDGLLYDLTEKQVYHIGQQILMALEFLQGKRLFHGDIAARNILIQGDLTAKLCGLGLAYEVHVRGAISSKRIVPLKWQAPERLLLKPAGIKGDVWSFGILLYEMVTLGAPPYPEVPPISILQYLQRRKIMKRPSSCSSTMYSIMKSCWKWHEDSRPSPTQLRLRLEAASQGADDKAVLQVFLKPHPWKGILKAIQFNISVILRFLFIECCLSPKEKNWRSLKAD
ncbi:tyrosine-protein kinase STYK1 isoform X1 [Antechinus flavipes]|uniref:tyrosine-protein kinase STYK1 isoform X1 n=1 Tax=Antechinus flavipes TaxID=38775 RepID=UPI0022357181|nr:tyrosine-protein kinase STYK1 isoform X1 [Antechinus flavipes]